MKQTKQLRPSEELIERVEREQSDRLMRLLRVQEEALPPEDRI